jgi:hypothetical protein
MLLAITIGVRKFSAGRPEYTFGQTLIPTGVTVDGVRVQGDRVELDAVITSLPLMGAISRRPERISRRLELATRRLISRRLIDPQTVHQVVFWVRASAFSKTAPTDRWIVDTKSLLATFSDARTWEKMRNSAEGEVGQPALQNHMDSYNAPSSVVQEFDRIAENAKFLLTGISLPSRPDEKTALIREGQEDGFEACMKAIYPGNPEMARPSGWTKITLSKEQGCESALTLVTRMARASLIAYATSLATASKTKELVMDPKGARWLKRSRPTRLPKSAAEQKEMAAAASHGINGCLGWMFGNDFQPKVLPDTQSLESVGYVDPADGCRDLSLRVMEKLLASEPAKK